MDAKCSVVTLRLSFKKIIGENCIFQMSNRPPQHQITRQNLIVAESRAPYCALLSHFPSSVYLTGALKPFIFLFNVRDIKLE